MALAKTKKAAPVVVTAKSPKTNGKTSGLSEPSGPRPITSYLSWMDGKIVNPDEAKVHFLSHALHYGTGVFEGLRCYETPRGPAIFRLREHIRRLYYSASFLQLKIPYSQEHLCQAVVQTVAANHFRECYIRPVVFYGEGGLGFKVENNEVRVGIGTYPLGTFLGEKGLREGVRVKTASWRKTPSTSVPSAAKLNGNYVNALLAFTEVNRAGYDEAMMLRHDGNVAEGAGDNVFVVKDGELFTPATSEDNLNGVTRDSILRIAKHFKIPVHETTLSRANVIGGDEVFLTGTAVEVTPVREVDDITIGDGSPGPITKKIQDAYFRSVRGQLPGFESWLTFVPTK